MIAADRREAAGLGADAGASDDEDDETSLSADARFVQLVKSLLNSGGGRGCRDAGRFRPSWRAMGLARR